MVLRQGEVVFICLCSARIQTQTMTQSCTSLKAVETIKLILKRVSYWQSLLEISTTAAMSFWMKRVQVRKFSPSGFDLVSHEVPLRS